MQYTIASRAGLSLDRLQTLILLADHGSFAAAASKDLNRQSQYSRQISELEKCFECKLTERHGRSIKLTPAGHCLANLAREHLKAIERFATDVAGMPTSVRIGAGEALLDWLLIPRQSCTNEKQEIIWHYFNLQSADIADRLLDHRLDFGVLTDIHGSTRLKTCKLGLLETSIFAPAKLFSHLNRTVENAITKLPLALLEGSSRTRQAVAQYCIERKCMPNIRYECTSYLQIAAIVSAGLAAAPLPTMARRALTSAETIEFVLTPILGKPNPLYLAWNPRAMETNSRLERIRATLSRTLRTDTNNNA